MGLTDVYLLTQSLGLNWNFWTILLLEILPALLVAIVVGLLCIYSDRSR